MNLRTKLAAVFGVVVLVFANYVIHEREQLIEHGQIVLLSLAPVDPRSLMQGDYMALRFGIGRNFPRDRKDGYVVLNVDDRGVGQIVGFDDGTPLRPNQVRMRYRVRGDSVKFATNAFFFEEGQGDRYRTARYGEFRVADSGEALLTGLRDAELRSLPLPGSD